MKTRNLKIALKILEEMIAKENSPEILRALKIAYNTIDNELLTILLKQ